MKRRSGDECQILLEQLSAYIDGDLAAPECAMIEKHMETCERCAAVIRDLRDTVGLCHRAAERPLPDAVKRRARARIRDLLDRSPV